MVWIATNACTSVLFVVLFIVFFIFVCLFTSCSFVCYLNLLSY